jgi:hypothetical protein
VLIIFASSAGFLRLLKRVTWPSLIRLVSAPIPVSAVHDSR